MKTKCKLFIFLLSLSIFFCGCGGGGDNIDNQPPIADAGPDQTVTEGSLVNLNASNSTDPDGNIASCLWTQVGGKSISLHDPTSMQCSFIAPDVGPQGESLTFELTITDSGGLADTDTCIINVSYLNNPPIADAGPDQTVDEVSLVTLDGSSSFDPEGGTLKYLWIQLSGSVTVTLSDSTAPTPTFTAPFGGPESYEFELKVEDDGLLTATDTVIISVANSNQLPPVSDAGPDQTVSGGDPVEMDGTGSSDPEGLNLTYLWTQTTGTHVTLSDTTAPKPTFIAPSTILGDTLTFNLRVKDEEGLFSDDTVDIIVEEVTTLPVVAILVDPSIEAAIQDELSVFVSDLSSDGFATIMHTVTESTPPQLRSYLQGLYNDQTTDLVGAILIGSVPTPRYYIFYPAEDWHPQRGPMTGASYQYYEDLDGEFRLLDANQWLYDDHTGDVESEIWVSVLPPLASNTETITAIQRYFQKNHLYRVGLEVPEAGYLNPIIGAQIETEELYNYQVDYVLGLIPGSYEWSWGPLTSRGNILVAPNNLLDDPVNFPGSDEVFYQEIQSGHYDILTSSTHGNAYGIGSNGYWYDRNYLNNYSINVLFWFEGGCSTADLDVVPSFAVTALYSETSKILAYRGATMDQGALGGSSNGFHRMVIGTALANGKSIGEAILEHRSVPLSANYASQREYFAAQHILLGDGTLRLQEFQQR